MTYLPKWTSPDERKSFIVSQSKQFELTILGHELNIERLKSLDEDTSQQEAAEAASIATIVVAIEVNNAKIVEEGGEVPVPATEDGDPTSSVKDNVA